jgi:hypothetical protein
MTKKRANLNICTKNRPKKDGMDGLGVSTIPVIGGTVMKIIN